MRRNNEKNEAAWIRDRVNERRNNEQNEAAWIRDRVKDAKQRCERMWGHGWRLLSKDIQDAYVAREVLGVIAQQHDETNLLVRLATAGLSYEEI